MRKMSFKQFVDLKKRFEQINSRYGLNQQLIPYFISSHPACDMGDMVNLASQTAALGYRLQQVQDFTPTPMTTSSVMFYTGLDPKNLEKVFVERDLERKKEQKSFFFKRGR